MNVPVTTYIGLGSDWLFLILTLGGYFYILHKTGKKWAFMLIFAAMWVVMGISYLFLVIGVSSNEWYITLLRIIGYLLFLAMILTAIVELTKSGRRVE